MLALGACELLLQIFDFKPPIFKVKTGMVKMSKDAVVGYVLDPTSPDINSFGIRATKSQSKKPNDTYRIVTLSDSVAFGWAPNALLKNWRLILI